MAPGGESKDASELPWEQGSMLPEGLGVLPLQWVHSDNPTTKIGRGAVTAAERRGEVKSPLAVPGPGKQGDRMVVLTQSCDLIRPPDELPQVEVARLFATKNERTIIQAQDFGSARYFRLNDVAEAVAQVLDYGWRGFIEKGFLAAVAPDNTLLESLTDERRKTFARWLGQRYSRPAIPDEDYELITRPVRYLWKQLVDGDPETAARFNGEYAEWRYRREEDGSLSVYILSAREHPDEVTALEVIDFLVEALQPGYPGAIRVPTDKRSYHTFTKADELSTEQISMEWASHEEGADDAALPGE